MMKRMLKVGTMVGCFVLCGLCSCLYAAAPVQETDAPADEQTITLDASSLPGGKIPAAPVEIAPAKKELIKAFLDITEATKMVENFSQTITMQLDRSYPQIMTQMVTRDGGFKDTSAEEKTKMLNESKARFFASFQEKYKAQVNPSKVIDDIYYPAYDKAFTDEDLKGLTAFFKTPLGEKLLKTQPRISQEIMQKLSASFHPKVMQLIDELMKSEQKQLVDATKPKEAAAQTPAADGAAEKKEEKKK